MTLDHGVQPEPLPAWDTTVLFPSVDSPELAAAIEGLGAEIDRLRADYDAHGVGAQPPHPPSAAEVAAFDAIVTATNRADVRLGELRSFLLAFVSTDSTDRVAQARSSELDATVAVAVQLRARFTAWVASLGADNLVAASEVGADHAGPLRRLEVRARHQMSPDEEALYGELSLTGSHAWRRLYGDVTSQLVATVEHPTDGPTSMPMAAVRNLAYEADPAVRRAGFEAELAAWPTVAAVCAASLNALKGEANVVNGRRAWSDPLDASCYANSVERATFDAMQAAVTEALPDFHRFLRAKARLLGHDGTLPWWDLFAPAPSGAGAIDFADATAFVADAFDRYSPALGAMARRAVRERWIDAAPRAGKRGGAFCMSFVDDRSLVFLNWSDTFDAVQTLAHELGHAYHNTHLAHRTPLQRQLPMTLAETASIFCETIAVDAGLAAADADTRLALLDLDLSGAMQVVVDIRSRFEFERDVFERRKRRALGVEELCEAMVRSQASAYGDALDPSTRHPWMWAVKPHYYNSHFYNWPYTFGLLFGLGLHTRYLAEPDAFRAGYDDLLSMVGMVGAEQLGARFGFDVRDIGFWRESLARLRSRIDDYEALVARRVGRVGQTRPG